MGIDKRMPSNRLASRASVLFLCALPALGQSAPSLAENPPGALQAELQPLQTLYRPDGPLMLRFTLRNTSDQPFDVPLDPPLTGNDGIALPLQLALGNGEQRSLTVFCEKETPRDVSPPTTPATSSDGLRTLRLAPHASVGADFDLREHYSAARYPGTYRIEWRPLGGQAGTATAQFRVEPQKDAIIVTDYGKMTIALDYDHAPRNVENFLELVDQGFYNGKTFHKLIPGFLIQGGSPKGDATGIRADSKLVPAEFHDAPFDVGTVAMARKKSDPNSASCQFFIGLGRVEELDRQYTVIGHARDEESLRTFQALAAVATDRYDRPLTPIVIRSINLVDAGETRVRILDPRTTPTSAPAASSAKTGIPPVKHP